MTQRSSFNSSNLLTMDYDDITNVLRLTFVAGGLYEYYGVPQIVVNELQQARSAGMYFHQFIRGTYEYRRIF